MVRNGPHFWMYYPSTNSYMNMTLPPNVADPSAQDTTAQMRKMVEQLLQSTDLTYQGSEQVASRTTYKLHATPKPQASHAPLAAIKDATLWVDSKTWQVLKQDADLGAGGHMSMAFRSIEYNPTLPDSLFTFTPPAGAKKMDMPQMPVTK